jgi:16S rRNA (adenine1518-N6/adenine1519-N6)-dimethyltransferase
MFTPLTDIEYLQQLLAKHRLTPQRTSGQNFLIAPEVVEATVLALKGSPTNITELGAGLGTLTQGLLQAGYTIRAIERDQKLSQILPKQIPPKDREKLDLKVGDLRDQPWEWTEPYSIVGNIPYNLSGLIVRHLTQLTPERVILLVQQEVGQRLLAQPPDLSLIGLAVGLWSQTHILLDVPADCFWPAPQVNSALVLLIPRADALPLAEREQIITFAKPLFQLKRKQLLGSLQRVTGQPSTALQSLLDQLHIAPTARPQELSVEQWQALAKSMYTGNIQSYV